jgi:hypothetical protein
MARHESSMRLFGLLVRLGVPLRQWARLLEVEGADLLPPEGVPLLVVANHGASAAPPGS